MAMLGLLGTGDFAADQRPKNYRQGVLMLFPNGDCPITGLSSMMASEKTSDPEFKWWTEVFEARHMVQDGGEAAGVAGASLTLNVESGAQYCPAGTLLRVATTDPADAEYLLVTADPTTDTAMTVRRGHGLAAGTAVNAIADGTQISVIGSAHEEGSGAPTAIHRVPFKDYNYTQIFKTPFDITRTAEMTELRTGPQYQKDKAEALQRHMQDIERSLLFGKRHERIGPNGKPLRTTGGLLNFMTSNVEDYGGGATFDDLDTYFMNLFKYGSDTRVGFCGNAFISALNKLVMQNVQYRIDSPIKVYGMNLRTIETPYGTLHFKRHPLLTTDPAYNSSCWFLSPENMKYRFITDTTIKKNIQDNDEDLTKDQFLTECGFEFHHEETFGYIANL